jgi:16S rRNA (guanine966-N2)-methyltransferase
MRIIGGSLGGRRVNPPSKMPFTRPTTDIAKEGLFNILEHNFPLVGLTTLDLFGGTGSISFELASRGATQCTVVEKDRVMQQFIRKTAKDLGLSQIEVIQDDVFRFLRHADQPYDFIFAGPPYRLAQIDEIPEQIAHRNLLRPQGWFVLEHTPRNNYEGYPLYVTSRNYGTTIFSIFVNKAGSVPTPSHGADQPDLASS